ncbi:MAG: hypothetical protein M3Z98_02235 [Candidatus Dormibacteraeota bacterium]|nr:hypothetical protein [Candidatus Dormibacteraeota bacterium]
MDLAEEAAPSRLQVVLGWAGRHRRLLILVAVLTVLHFPFLLIARQIGIPSLLLFACLVSGFGLTYLSGIDLDFEERFFFGTVIGAMAVSLAVFVAASLLGFGVTSVWLGAAVALGVSAVGWFSGRRRVLPNLRAVTDRWARNPTLPGHPWPLLLVAGVAGIYVYKLFANAYRLLPDGLYAGTGGTWADWAAHLSYAGSFAYGANLPPQLPLDQGHHLPYPFMIDFLAASLIPLGATLPNSLVLSSAFLAFAFAPIMYLAGVRLTGSRAAAAIAPFIFTLSGGLGFTYFFGDLQAKGLAVLAHLPREYSAITADNYVWLTPLIASMLPQRSTLFGFAIVLIVLALLFTAVERPGWTTFLFAGVLTGLAPAFHVHGYGTCVALGAFWFVLHRRRQWLAFFVPALVLGIPVVLLLLPESGAQIRVQLGWLASNGAHHDNIAWFWLKNLGLFIPLLLFAQFSGGLARWVAQLAPARLGFLEDAFGPELLPKSYGLHFAPMWLWFVVPNIWLFHPWDWDNQKFFIYWVMLGSFLVAALVTRVARAGLPGAAAAVAMLLVLCLAGGLDAARNTDFVVSSIRFTDNAGLAVAAWSRTNTAPHAIFLAAYNHDSPIPTLGARRVVLGYPGWIWTYGISDWIGHEQDVQSMLQGSPDTPALVQRYNVSYVVIGPQERVAPFSANEAYWQSNAVLVYSNPEYHVYKVG